MSKNAKIEKVGNLYGFSGGNYGGNIYDQDGLSPAIHRPTGGNTQPIFSGGHENMKKLGPAVPQKIKRFRRLTPLEAWRLMAFDDIDFYRAKYGREDQSGTPQPPMSDTQLYSQAGNSIGVNVLVAIFGQMFEGHERDYEKLYFDRYEEA